MCLELKAKAESSTAADTTDDSGTGKAAGDPEIDIDIKKNFGIRVSDCVYVFAMLVRFYRAEHLASQALGEYSESGAGSVSLKEACTLIEMLATELDIVRRKYWLFELSQFAPEAAVTAAVAAATVAAKPPATPEGGEMLLCTVCSCSGKKCTCTPIL